MTIPRKHHYLPQVHIKKFEHKNGYNLFLKEENKIINKKLSVDIFSVKDLNSTLDEDGNIDHISVEQKLADQWDSKFNFHLNILSSWIIESIEQKNYSDIQINSSLKFFFEYGLLGYMRARKQDRDFNDSIINSILEFKELIPDIEALVSLDEQTEMGKSELKDILNLSTNLADEWNKKLKFPVPSTTEFPMLVPERLICDFFITLTPPFYLPDCTAIIIKSKETIEHQNKNLNKIVSVGIPLTQELFIQIRDKDFFPFDSTGLYSIEKERTESINDQLIFHAFKQVLVSKDFEF